MYTSFVITEAVFSFYFTISSYTSYFDLGIVDPTAMYDPSNLFMQSVVTNDNRWT